MPISRSALRRPRSLRRHRVSRGDEGEPVASDLARSRTARLHLRPLRSRRRGSDVGLAELRYGRLDQTNHEGAHAEGPRAGRRGEFRRLRSLRGGPRVQQSGGPGAPDRRSSPTLEVRIHATEPHLALGSDPFGVRHRRPRARALGDGSAFAEARSSPSHPLDRDAARRGDHVVRHWGEF